MFYLVIVSSQDIEQEKWGLNHNTIILFALEKHIHNDALLKLKLLDHSHSFTTHLSLPSMNTSADVVSEPLGFVARQV